MVIWAGDGHRLIFDMLEGRYIDEQIRTMYEKWMPVLPLVHVMMGVNRDMSKEPSRIMIELEKPIRIAEEDKQWLFVINHSFDPSMAPPGKSSVEVWFATKYDYWENLSHHRGKYERKRTYCQLCHQGT